ncbi:hypothetical protein ACFL27_04055 [candidate division CSSED10-310 bacterium]|uniref:Uncharacterized protein n=1 Tax=candidate division CSSED10-310 bacterium TaxID=2855610 RepID=A0ABV6YT61_UNCC1
MKNDRKRRKVMIFSPFALYLATWILHHLVEKSGVRKKLHQDH